MRRANSPDPQGAGWGYGGEATMEAKRNSGPDPPGLSFAHESLWTAQALAQRHQARRRQGSLAQRGETAKLARCAAPEPGPQGDAQG
jgi:hypothetical protein